MAVLRSDLGEPSHVESDDIYIHIIYTYDINRERQRLYCETYAYKIYTDSEDGRPWLESVSDCLL